jgi:hypothetical protein
MNPTTSASSEIELARLTNYAAFILFKHGFVASAIQSDGSACFKRPNSNWAVNMLVDSNRVIIERACSGPIMIGGTFVEAFLRSGLFTLEMRNGLCAIVSR